MGCWGKTRKENRIALDLRWSLRMGMVEKKKKNVEGSKISGGDERSGKKLERGKMCFSCLFYSNSTAAKKAFLQVTL